MIHKILLIILKAYYKHSYKDKSKDIVYNKIVYMHYANEFVYDLRELIYLFNDNPNIQSDTYLYINTMLEKLYNTFDQETLNSDENAKFDSLINEEYSWLSSQNRIFLKGKLYRNAM